MVPLIFDILRNDAALWYGCCSYWSFVCLPPVFEVHLFKKNKTKGCIWVLMNTMVHYRQNTATYAACASERMSADPFACIFIGSLELHKAINLSNVTNVLNIHIKTLWYLLMAEICRQYLYTFLLEAWQLSLKNKIINVIVVKCIVGSCQAVK